MQGSHPGLVPPGFSRPSSTNKNVHTPEISLIIIIILARELGGETIYSVL